MFMIFSTEKINLNKIFLQVEAQGGVVLGAAYSFQSSARGGGTVDWRARTGMATTRAGQARLHNDVDV